MATADIAEVLPFGRGSSRDSYSAHNSVSPLREVEREVMRSIQGSQYIRRYVRLESFIDPIKELARLKPNWDSYGAEPPNTTSVKSALQFLNDLTSTDLLPIRILPSAEGGVAFRFVSMDKRALVEFLNDGSVEAILYDSNGDLVTQPEEPEAPSEVIKSVLAHFTR
jgi:hypothetical protein